MKNDESAALLSPLEQARKVLAVTLEMADGAIGREDVFGEQVVTVRWMRSALTPILADLDAALSATAPDAGQREAQERAEVPDSAAPNQSPADLLLAYSEWLDSQGADRRSHSDLAAEYLAAKRALQDARTAAAGPACGVPLDWTQWGYRCPHCSLFVTLTRRLWATCPRCPSIPVEEAANLVMRAAGLDEQDADNATDAIRPLLDALTTRADRSPEQP